MTLEALWAEYARRSRPAHIGAAIDGVRLGELDDEIQDVISSWGMGRDLGLSRVARLGLAVADAERVLPATAPGEEREYVALLAALGRAALVSLVRGVTEREASNLRIGQDAGGRASRGHP